MYTQLAVIGGISGILTGTIGMGGGVVMTVLLLHVGVPLPQAVAIGLVVQLVPQSLFGVLEYHRAGFLNVGHSAITAAGSALGIYLGAIGVTHKLVPLWLMYRLLGAFVTWSGIYVLFYMH
jgi:uncharacterized membrane protein YfcA